MYVAMRPYGPQGISAERIMETAGRTTGEVSGLIGRHGMEGPARGLFASGLSPLALLPDL
jgi:hypothetical protein